MEKNDSSQKINNEQYGKAGRADDMKRKAIFWVFVLLSMMTILFTLSGCKEEAESIEEDTQSYTAESVGIPDAITDISRLYINNNLAYLCCTEVENNGESTSYLATMTLGKGEFDKLSLDTETSTQFMDFGIDVLGDIWAVCHDVSGKYSLREFDRDGNTIKTVDLSSVLDADVISQAGAKLFMSIDSEGNICVAMKYINTYVYVFDNQGIFLFNLYYEGNLLTAITTAEGYIGMRYSAGQDEPYTAYCGR